MRTAECFWWTRRSAQLGILWGSWRQLCGAPSPSSSWLRTSSRRPWPPWSSTNCAATSRHLPPISASSHSCLIALPSAPCRPSSACCHSLSASPHALVPLAFPPLHPLIHFCVSTCYCLLCLHSSCLLPYLVVNYIFYLMALGLLLPSSCSVMAPGKLKHSFNFLEDISLAWMA